MRSAWLALALSLLTLSAHAESRSVSYSVWSIVGNEVIVRVLVPAPEAQRLTGSAIPVLTSAKLSAYVLQHLAVRSREGNCGAIDQGYDIGRVDPLSVGVQLYGFEIIFQCRSAPLQLENTLLFERAPQHVNFARLQRDGRTVEALFTRGRRQINLPLGAAIGGASVLRYASLGWLHIVRSADRCCFLLAALLLVRRRTDLQWIGVGLAGGYLLSALEISGGWVLPQLPWLDAFIGFLIVLLATLRWSLQGGALRGLPMLGSAALLLLAAVTWLLRGWQPSLLLLGAALLSTGFVSLCARAGMRAGGWLLAAALFSFLDGYVLTAQLTPLQLPNAHLLWMSLGFDLGAVTLELLLLAAVSTLYQWVRQRWRRISLPMAHEWLAAAVAGAGTFWFVSRLYAG